MSAVIIGSPLSGKKVLQRQNFQRDINGLETIVEDYMIRTADRSTIAPQKDTLHSAFSSASIGYSRMAVETISFNEENGDLTTMSVVYVGLTSSSGLPKPVVRMIPTTGAGIFGPPLTIEVEFVTDVNETQIATGQLTSTSVVQKSDWRTTYGAKIPNILNGLTLPSNPVEPFSKQLGYYGGFEYLGYCQDNVDCTRRGQFLIARVVYKEKQLGVGSTAAISEYTKI
jgi:hypothetical protein